MTTVLARSLSLIAILFLAACDAPQLLPPDARLPDGSTYSGDIQNGTMSGQGVFEDDGSRYEDENTLIMTSAREDRTSFGCGDDSEMTWFTKAVYQSVGLSLTDPDAMFEQINQQIRTWEEEIGMEEERWSYPQSRLGESLREWIR